MKSLPPGLQDHLDSGATTLAWCCTITSWKRPSGLCRQRRLHHLRGLRQAAETCRAKFANILNFSGLPHIPGQDVVIRYATNDGGHDGAMLRRLTSTPYAPESVGPQFPLLCQLPDHSTIDRKRQFNGLRAISRYARDVLLRMCQ